MTPDVKHYPARTETQPDGAVLIIAACGYVGYSPAVFVKIKDGNSASAAGVTCAGCLEMTK